MSHNSHREIALVGVGGQRVLLASKILAETLMREGHNVIMSEIHGDDCLGSMWYGDTISFGADFDQNLGLNAEYLLWDIVAQLVCPTGHAVLPLPVTEAVRIPTAQAIAHVHIFARRVEEAARRLASYLDLTPAERIRDRLVEAGRKVFERALRGLEAQGVDIQNPLEMIYVLKKIGPVEFERQYGAGAPDPSWPRGRKPVELTDMFARTYRMSQEIIRELPEPTRENGPRVVLASTDVHEHALFVIQRALDAMGFSPVIAGSEMNPTRVVEMAHDRAAAALVVGTYNGMALEFGRALRRELDRLGLRIPVFMGGRLNQVVEHEALPVDVSRELAALGFIPCQTIPEMLHILDDMII